MTAGRRVALVALMITLVSGPAAAGGQDACSCDEKDPLTEVELHITRTQPQDFSRIGPDQETVVVDLRGAATELVGDAPELLQGADLAAVPVLMALSDEPCGVPRPEVGRDLSVTGHVYEEETGPTVWTGPCQGTLTVLAAESAAAATPSTDDWDEELRATAAVLILLASVSLVAVPLVARRADRARSTES